MKSIWITFFTIACVPLMFAQKVKLPAQLAEVSGIEWVGDQLYAINDGGNPFTLYVTDLKGQLLDSLPFSNLENIDIEDLTRDDQGNWYIADFGNNANKRKNLKIYKFSEDFALLGTIQFNYPDQKSFPPAPEAMMYDTEALAYYEGNLHIFTKSRWPSAGYITHHYILPTLPGSFTAKLLESISFPERVITAAAVSPNQKQIALLGYTFKKSMGIFPKSKASVFLLDLEDKNFFFSKGYQEIKVPSSGATQFESVTWSDNKTLILASEKGLKKHPFMRTLSLEP